jgi:diguanylate cyclase (GGDEF)-like protein
MSALSLLLVEDEAAVADLVRIAVRPWNDSVHLFPTAGAAMESRIAIDVAIIDLDLQKGAGLALVHFFRARDPNLEIVALVRSGDAEGEVVAHALGCSTAISKPLTGDALLVSLSSVRERKATRAAAAARVSTLPLAPVLQASDARSLAAAIADAAYKVTHSATRVVLDDPRDGEIEARAGMGDPTESLPLVALDETVGTLQVASGTSRQQDLDLLALSGATVGVLLRRLDSTARVGIKDPETSAYTFAYFVDAAGREIERARRYGRRFALLTFLIDNYGELRARSRSEALREARRELVDTILDTVRDTDILANVEDDEMYLLVPEAGMMGALACRRRIAEKQRKRAERGKIEGRPGLQITIGVATFPRDGRDLTALLKAAHKRNNAARQNSAGDAVREWQGGLEGMLGALLRFRADDRNWQTRQAALASEVIAAMSGAVAREATRGTGSRDGVLYLAGDRQHPLVRAAIDVIAPAGGVGTPAYWLKPRLDERREDSSLTAMRSHPVEVEVDGSRIGPFALMVALTESWAYACVASQHGDYKRVMHTSELDVVESLLAELQTTFHLQRGLE